MEILNMLLRCYFLSVSLDQNWSQILQVSWSLNPNTHYLKDILRVTEWITWLRLAHGLQLLCKDFCANFTKRFCCPCWVFPCYCSQSREGERERGRGWERWRKRQEKGFGLRLAPPHTQTLLSLINSFYVLLCFVLCFRSAGVCGQSFASMHTESFLWFRSVTNSQTSHSTGMYHSRIFPSVRPEDFMILMRDAWYSLSGNVIC